MREVTRLLGRIDAGDPSAADELLPIVYAELRRLAAHRLSHEPSDLTLQPTALVHEAYLRLVDVPDPQRWDNRGHFFAAAAEAMRRILVEGARRRSALKHGGGVVRLDAAEVDLPAPQQPEEILAVDEALERLQAVDAPAAELVKLRYFSGLTLPEAAAILRLSPRRTDRLWAFAKAWLHRELRGPVA